MYTLPQVGVLSLRSHIEAVCHDSHRKDCRQYLRCHQSFTHLLGIVALFPVLNLPKIHSRRMEYSQATRERIRMLMQAFLRGLNLLRRLIDETYSLDQFIQLAISLATWMPEFCIMTKIVSSPDRLQGTSRHGSGMTSPCNSHTNSAMRWNYHMSHLI